MQITYLRLLLILPLRHDLTEKFSAVSAVHINQMCSYY